MKAFRKDNAKKRYPNELLYEMVQYRLQQNDCQHRGFVLDGFPRTYEDAKGVFYFTLKKKEKEAKEGEGEGEGDEEPQDEGEEDDPDKYKPKFMKHIYPESVIMLYADDDELKDKARKLPKEVMKESHYYENHMDRRLQTFHETNDVKDYRYGLEPGKPSLTYGRFFQEKETEMLEVDATLDNFELFESMRIYIERHGRPYNYLDSLEKLNNDRHFHLEELESEELKKKETEENASLQKQEREKARYARLAQERFPEIENHMVETK
jgi:adenylate kinase